ncbi:MAG: MurR/RpiR family transcriptional regulator [Chloroflexi bacterium]|nr:MurR/RpiR family transcriptional regulator [Chloroflexota bacterium]
MLLETIRNHYTTLSKSHRKLADYIMAHYRQTAFMTSAQLASKVGVNSGTITRFAQYLGYTGYPEMVAELHALVLTELKGQTADSSDAAPGRLQHSLSALSEQVTRMPQQLDLAAAESLAGLLERAERVILVGQGAAAELAAIYARLSKSVGKPVIAPSGDPYAITAEVSTCKPGDLVIALALFEESQTTARALRHAAELGADTAALCATPTSPAALAAALPITWMADEDAPLAALCQLSWLLAGLLQAWLEDVSLAGGVEDGLRQTLEPGAARRRR